MWEVPVLLKQHFAWRRLRPFAGAGPTFRKTNLAGPVSPYGVVAGAGIDIPWWRVRISPTVRYTHWASRYSYDKVFQNQFEILVGASF